MDIEANERIWCLFDQRQLVVFCCARRWTFEWRWLEYGPDWQYLGWNLTATSCKKTGRLLKTVAGSIGQAADAVATVDVGVLAHDDAFLFG